MTDMFLDPIREKLDRGLQVSAEDVWRLIDRVEELERVDAQLEASRRRNQALDDEVASLDVEVASLKASLNELLSTPDVWIRDAAKSVCHALNQPQHAADQIAALIRRTWDGIVRSVRLKAGL